ncbi:PiggyBac transposase uribo2 [Plakobranchus ocellatus]|uniref:PiggyBac transposase uribo2 n=1 Tax=Plakobranchus ocellatus TaxID=259542 RepID=A0AAV4AM82_9GAST|nr:PiggyBac transposase uribo2 [Plakobranchus ocellatus]
MYSGKDDPITNLNDSVPAECRDMSVTSKTTVALMKSFLNKGYHLYVDNWYSSVPLLEYFHSHKTMCTAKANCVPKQLKTRKTAKGETVAFSKGPVLAQKIEDKRTVYMLTTGNGYNKNMGGVDQIDQLIEPYNATHTGYATRKEPAETPASTALPAPLSPDLALFNAFSYITPRRHSGHNTFREVSCCISADLREFFSGFPPIDMRGENDNRPHKISEEQFVQIVDHMQLFKGRQSHYSRNKSRRENLSENLNVTKMHSLFRGKYPNSTLSYESYRPMQELSFKRNMLKIMMHRKNWLRPMDSAVLVPRGKGKDKDICPPRA